MANVVEITITVSNSQADAAVKATSANLKQMGIDAQVSSGQLVGSANSAGTAIKSLGGHSATSLDSVRLLSQEFGLRLPRALEAMISRVPAVTSALQSLVGIAAGIATIEVGVRVVQGLDEIYEKYLSLNAAADKFWETLQKTAKADFTGSRGLEATSGRLSQSERQTGSLQAESDRLHSMALFGDLLNPIAGVSDLYNAHQAATELAEAQANVVKLTDAQNQQQHERSLRSIQLQYADDGTHSAADQANRQRQQAYATAGENQDYTRKQDAALGNYAGKNDGAEERRQAEQAADQEYAKKRIDLANQETSARIKAQDEAVQAGLRGEALYTEKQRDAVRERMQQYAMEHKAADPSVIAALNQRFDNERIARLRQLTDQTDKLAEASSRASLEGVPKIAAENSDRLADIERRRHETLDGSKLPQRQLDQFNNQFDRQRSASNAQSIQEREKLDADYTDFVRNQVAARTEAELTGFAKIEAARAREKGEAQQRYNRSYTDKDGNDFGSETNHADLNAQMKAIDGTSDAERLRLSQEIGDRTLQMDQQAADAERRIRKDGLAGWVQDFQASIADIEARNAEMHAKIDAEQRKEGGDPAQYERQKVDADRVANAQVIEANEQMRQQIAGTLQGAFDDPIHYIQNKMKEMMFQILADWIMQTDTFKSLFGSKLGSLQGQSSGQGGSAAGGLTGMIAQHLGLGHAASGTLQQASVSPGYSGTVEQASTAPGFSGTAAIGGGFGGAFGQGGFGHPSISAAASSTGVSGLGDLGSLAQTGMSAAAALSGTSNTGDSSAADAALAAHNDADDPLDDTAAVNAGVGPGAAAASGSSASSGFNPLGVLGAAAGAYTGTEGVISSFESGKASGILGGASSGAELGASVGLLAGPIGSAIGAGIGAVGGAAAGLVGWATGEGNRIKAEKYYKDNIKPQMDGAEESYMKGSGDSSSAISAINAAAHQGFEDLAKQVGGSAAFWAKSAYIDKEQNRLVKEIEQLAQGGRDYTSASAVQFHTGGLIDGFGDLGTSSNEGFIHAMLGETVMNPVSSSAHGPALSAMNAGASHADIASMYMQAAGGGSLPAQAGGGDTHHHWDVTAMDSRSFKDFLVNGGGMDQIASATNKRNTRYLGDAN